MKEIEKEEIVVENMIYEIRGKQVMLDSDLARLYQVETKRINEAVKRNLDRFPIEFCFQLTEFENSNLRSQFATSSLNINEYGGRRYLPYVFTEQGIAMLSAVLKSDIAIKTSIKIMNAFVAMRRYLSSNLVETKILEKQVLSNTERIDKNEKEIAFLQQSFQKFEEKKVVNEIYFNGQIYDAYSKLLDIFNEASKEIIVIDGYADKVLLDTIRNLPSTVDVNSNLKVEYDDTFHDRYFILDQSIVYHCGTSINYAGSKTFSINLLEDEMVKKSLLEHIK